jgi:molybdenum cofactor cytidylyltransferase
MICAILLAAGLSSRMGRLKQLLPFRHKTFIDNAIENLLASNVDQIILVLGHSAKEITLHLKQQPYINHSKLKVVLSEDYLFGMTSSIKTGLNASVSEVTAYLITLVDQPHIPVEVINLLIESYKQNNFLIVKPTYQKKSGHPIIINASLKEQILKLPDEVGLNQITRAYSKETLLVEVENKEILEDFDTWEEYLNYQKGVIAV